MGLFGRFRQDVEEVEQVLVDALLEADEGVRTQVTTLCVVLTLFFLLKLLKRNSSNNNNNNNEATDVRHCLLDLSCLNDCANFKEVFLSYLQAALLEPVLAIGGMERAQDMEFIINVLTLISICWWIWLITDAFDFTDVMQVFKYSNEFRPAVQADRQRFGFLRLSDVSVDADQERKTLGGSLARDVPLWFMIASIAAAWLPGKVTHRDCLHAYVVVFLWTLLHQFCRRSTVWTDHYLMTFFFPSTALMPLEYCLPLMDVADTVEDEEFLVSYRDFVEKRTGMAMTIRS